MVQLSRAISRLVRELLVLQRGFKEFTENLILSQFIQGNFSTGPPLKMSLDCPPRNGSFWLFGGTENATSGARIKILRPLFNTNTPLKPPSRHFGNHFGPRKSDFQPFCTFWSILVFFTGGGLFFFGRCMIFNRNFTQLNDILFLTSGYHWKALCVQIANNYSH